VDERQPTQTDIEGASPTTVDRSTTTGWGRADLILGQMSVLMADGLEPVVIGAQARGYCQSAPSLVESAWSCVPDDAPRVLGRELNLEVGDDGVVALTARGLPADESQKMADAARLRWASWCTEPFRRLAGPDESEQFAVCALPGGPTLVVGRFPRGEEVERWQVSLAVMPAG